MESSSRGVSLMGLYGEAGIPATVLPAIAATPAGQAWFPTGEDMLQAGIATDLAEPGQFALAGFGPRPTPQTVADRLLDVPAYRAIAAADPAGWAQDLTLWTRTVLDGAPGEPAFAQTRAHLAALFQRALRRAPDALLLEHARLFVEEVAWLQDHAPAECASWARSQGGMPGPADEGLAARRSALRLAVVGAAPAADPPAEPEAAPLSCPALRLAWQAALNRTDPAAAARQLVVSGE